MASLLLCLIAVSVVAVPGSGHVRLEYGLALIGSALAITSGGAGRIRLLRGELALLAAMFASGLLSIAVYSITQDAQRYDLAQRDVLSVIRFPTYALFLMLGVALAPSDARGMRRLWITVVLLAVGTFLLSVAQYFDFLGLNLALVRLYAPESLAFGNLDQLLAGASNRRVSGTLGNPNWWGWWILTLAVFTYCWGSSARLTRVAPLLAALAVALLLTGSRTSLVSLLVGLGAATAAMSSVRGRRSARTAAGALVVLLMLGSGWFAMQTLYEAQDRFSVRRLDSLFERFRVWERGVEVFAEHPILGTGPRKGDLLRDSPDARRVSFVDNAYLAVLARFGMVGLTLYLSFLALVSVRALHAARAAPEALRWWPTAMFGAWASCAVFGFAADTIFAVQPMLLLSLFHGISIGVGAARPAVRHTTAGGRLTHFSVASPGGPR